MSKKQKPGIFPMLQKGGAQVTAFGLTAAASEGAGQLAIDAAIKKGDETTSPAAQAKTGAIKAGVSILVGGIGGAAALATKAGRAYAPAIVGGALLKAAVDTLPVARWLAGKVRSMFAKKAEPPVNGSGAIARDRSTAGTRDLVD